MFRNISYRFKSANKYSLKPENLLKLSYYFYLKWNRFVWNYTDLLISFRLIMYKISNINKRGIQFQLKKIILKDIL